MTVLKRVGGLLILLFALGLLLLAHWQSGFAAWYALNIYPIFPRTIGWFVGLLPFSLFEASLLFIILYALWVVGRLVYRLVNSDRRAGFKANFKKSAARVALRISYALPIFLLVFVLTAGINYNRESFADHIGITVQNSSQDELINMYLLLVERAEILARQIETDDEGFFILRRNGLYRYARQAMENLHEMHGGLGTFFPRAKAPVTSRLLLSNFNIGGFFSPWTVEAHYNGDMPCQSIPFIITHELAHVAGHMREDEANFIAYLACRESDNIDFQYSAVYRGIRYALNALFRVVDSEKYAELFALLPDQIRRDIAGSRAYWQQFQGRAAEVMDRVNDAYLRLNQQADGVQSYGRMVDLMLAYYRALGLLD